MSAGCDTAKSATKSLIVKTWRNDGKISVTLGASKKSDRLTKRNKTLFIHK